MRFGTNMTIRNGKQISAMLISAAAVCLCGTTAASEPVPKEEKEMDDQAVTDHIEDELLFDQGVLLSRIDVETSNGVVTLTGEVNNLLAKQRAARIAETVRGVRAVVNRIQVSPTIQHPDSRIEKNIESAWLSDPATDSYEIQAEVDRGTAMLTGTVQSWQEKKLAEIVAAGVSGVREIDSRIMVDYKQDRPDTEIRNEIEQALKWNVYVRFGSTADVQVKDGRVTLTASAGSVAEKNRMAEAAWVAGVKDVDVTGVSIRSWLNDDQQRTEQYPDVTDSQMKKAIEDALLYDPRVNMFNVKSDVSGGQATLRGTVSSLKAKRAAAQDAQNTYGIWSVRNRLKVRSDQTENEAEIRDRIITALARDPFVERYEVKVVVDRGIVDLYGTVDTFYQKSRAEDLASRVEGVAVVDNNLIVSDLDNPFVYDPYIDPYYPHAAAPYRYEPNGTDVTDSEIRQEIRDELWWSPFVDSEQVTVSVDDGVATLKGEVDSWHERQSAYENAFEGGAVRVINKLEVN